MKTASSPVLLSIITGVLGLYTRWQELKHILDTSSTLTTGGLGDTRNSGSCVNGSAVGSTLWNTSQVQTDTWSLTASQQHESHQHKTHQTEDKNGYNWNKPQGKKEKENKVEEQERQTSGIKRQP